MILMTTTGGEEARTARSDCRAGDPPVRKSVFVRDDGTGEACTRHDTTSPRRLRLRAGERIALLTDTLGLELTLL